MRETESTALLHIKLSHTGDAALLVFFIDSRFDQFDSHKCLTIVVSPMNSLFAFLRLSARTSRRG